MSLAVTLFLSGVGSNSKVYAANLDFKAILDSRYNGFTLRSDTEIKLSKILEILDQENLEHSGDSSCFTISTVTTDMEYFRLDGSGNDINIVPLKVSDGKKIPIVFTETASCDHKGVYGTVTDYLFEIIIADKNARPLNSNKGNAPCNHSYEWEVVKEATATQDGEEVYKCIICGEVQDQSRKSVTGYSVFSNETVKAIRNAAAGEVIVETNLWESFPVKVLTELSAKKDVSLTVRYRYQGKYYTLTIPARADLTKITEENLFVGFRYLDSLFGGSEIVK